MAQKEDRRIGSIIGGKWRVDYLLGTGSMAAVYAVTHRNGVKAALKILHPQLCMDATVCERFLGEGHLTNSVKHKGIVRVLDDGMTDDGCVFLVMDLLEGTTLEGLRQERGGKLGLDEALDIADQLMDALHAVHEAGIIHRDLKPQNVFICNNDAHDVKLLDFGVARILETTKAATKMSLFGMVLGTPSFMSPEQAIGARHQVDQRTDVYSLGATIFTALTGETVHLGPHVQAKLLAAGTTQARSIAVVKQDLPPAIAAVIDTALRFDKADRWQSVDAFRRALRDARNVAPSLAPISASVPPPSLKRRSAYPKAVLPTTAPPEQRRTKTLMGVGSPVPSSFPLPAKTTLPYGVDPNEVATLPEAKTEESYPAVHTPIPLFEQTDPLLAQLTRKRSGAAAFVVTSLALLALAIAGVAFFASGDGSGSTSAAAAIQPAPLPETTLDAGPPAPAASIVIGDPDVPETTDASVRAPASRTQTAITPPLSWHPHRTQSPPANPPPLETTPTLAPDPFATPE